MNNQLNPFLQAAMMGGLGFVPMVFREEDQPTILEADAEVIEDLPALENKDV